MTSSSTFQFEFPELSKINGEPNFCTVLNLLQELKTNVQHVHSNFGGNEYGYLTLVIDNTDFLALPNTAVVTFLLNLPD